MMNRKVHILTMLLLLVGVTTTLYTQNLSTDTRSDLGSGSTNGSKVQIYGNVYGGGELAQVTASSAEAAKEQLIQDADLADLFTTHADHVYTTYVHLGEKSEVYGRVFGGGQGDEDGKGDVVENIAGSVTGQTDVALDGATVWSEIYGGGEMADVNGNTLVHFKKGKAGHNAFGGGLGKLTANEEGGKVLPDNRQTVLASADIKEITGWSIDKKTGESFVVFDGKEKNGVATYTHYEFERARTINRDASGKPVKNAKGLYYTETAQFQPEHPEQLFTINHNIYGGGMTASKVEGKTFVHINYGMVNEEMMNFEHEGKKVWSMIYNSIANAQFCVFGGGYGYYTEVSGDANVTMDVQGDDQYKYIKEFTEWFAGPGKEKYHWDTNVGDPQAIYNAADEATWSHGAPGRSCMDIVGGGYNGKVLGTARVTVGGDVVLRKVYGGGYYSSVGNTDVQIKSGIFNRVYGGGMIGNVYGKAELTFGQQNTPQPDNELSKKEQEEKKDIYNSNLHLLVKDAIYGGNDVSGTVGTTAPGSKTMTHGGVTYNVYDPVDDGNHGVRLNIFGGLVLGDVYGAGNGNHPGYGNPDYMEFNLSQHPSENYRQLTHPGEKGTSLVYKYRPRTARVIMNLAGNAGTNFNDEPTVDKVRIWGRTFGGGNSCNVGVWDGTMDDIAENYSEKDWDFEKTIAANLAAGAAWHPGDNFQGGGTIEMNIGSHVQLGNRNDSHTTPNGLFMGSNGEHMITQHTDKELARYYHQYYDSKAKKYYPGFVVYEDDAVTPIKRTVGLKAFKAFINNILTKSDNVHLNINENAEDVWMSNFVGGGYRGSMQAESATGTFAYKLPKGVTVGHAVVGGAFNAHIIYRVYATNYGDGTYKTDSDGNYIYETVEPGQGVISKAEAEAQGLSDYDYIKKLYAEGHEGDDEYLTGYLRYNFDGGMLAMSSGMNAEDNQENTRIHAIKNELGTDFVGQNVGDTKSYNNNKQKALVRLDLHNMMEPEVQTNSETKTKTVHGGIVYGGCFSTGFIEGDTWVDYRCTISPLAIAQDAKKEFFDPANVSLYSLVDDMDTYNALKVFGAGFGTDTHSMGDVYVRILHDEDGDSPLVYNIFGGGNHGTVGGSTNVYFNAGNNGNLLGSLYGGGYKGTIEGNTFLELAGGKIVNAYAGSRQADIHGCAHVWAYDCAARPWGADVSNPQEAHLIISNLYGGNDVSGTISGTMRAAWSEDPWNESVYGQTNPLTGKTFNTYTQITGTASGGRGFPLIGNLYGGGNGEKYDETYQNVEEAQKPARPDVAKAMLEIDGGTTFYAFGGGNKATVTDSATIFTNCSNSTKFAEHEFTDDYQVAIVKNTFLHDKVRGYHWEGRKLVMDNFHVLNLFGGNNVADMAIQPTWNLHNGRLGNVFSGGNMGDMTHPDGISIHVESPSVYVNDLFGGCRMADVRPTGTGSVDWTDEDSYGATVLVDGGYIGNVYGGNDVSGIVEHGTHVTVSGAVNGNVYGSGNGNYLYVWDKDVDIVTEAHRDSTVYYRVPPMSNLGGANATPTQKLLTINEWRPFVNKTSIFVGGSKGEDPEGSDAKVAFVRGNVFCGGNASTIKGDNSFTKFNVGSYVTLNGIFMGSDGEAFSQNRNISELESENGLNMAATPDWTDVPDNIVPEADRKYYTNMLSLYMRAVEMSARPKNEVFGGGDPLERVFIGTACGGGNRGSMAVDQMVDVKLTDDITIFGRIVAGCYDANVEYESTNGKVVAHGGYIRPLKVGSVKLHYEISSKFAPLKMSVPESITAPNEYGDDFYTARQKNFLYPNYNGDLYAPGCNIYGGCFNSGEVLGDVELEVYSDLLEEPLKVENSSQPNRERLNKTSAGEVPAFNIYGAGFGMNSHVWGDVNIKFGNDATKARCNNIYGGGQSGYLIGNANINVLNGTIYRHIIGGSDAGYLYGSTHIAVGDPVRYQCKTKGEYTLNRADQWNDDKENADGTNPVEKSIKLLKGDVISEAVYNMIIDAQRTDANFEQLANQKTNWNTTDIYIGGGIYGGGYALATGSTVYAGDMTVRKYDKGIGYLPVDALLGKKDDSDAGYGGNATIMVADDILNATTDTIDHITISTLVPTIKTGMSSKLGFFTRSAEPSGTNALGDPVYTWTTQADGAPATDGTKYYALEGQGGIYGDGHLSFVEGFRSADIQRYGYAEYAPQNPKLLNTFQRLDVASVKDCCIMLQGARDFATNATDATIYSVSRVGEIQMHSSIDASALNPGTPSSDDDNVDRIHNVKRSRNYIGFYNNVHYIGALKSDVAFDATRFDEYGAQQSDTYLAYKKSIISANYPYGEDNVKYAAFRTRNLGTAKNMIGINNGYTLKIQNVFTTTAGEALVDNMYYGPVVGVFEAKLLSLVPGEGGGYIYADNVHAEDNNFMNTPGNFVFPSTVAVEGESTQYIVDDCFPTKFDGAAADKESHYWYVEGNKYWFHTSITGYTADNPNMTFNMDNVDQIVTLFGTKKESTVKVKSITWEHAHSAEYNCDILNTEKRYDFSLSVSDNGRYNEEGGYLKPLSRTDVSTEQTLSYGDDVNRQGNPLLGIQLIDNVNNNGAGYYDDHLKEPCTAKIVLVSTNDGQEYTYNVNLDVIYLKGPSVTGAVVIDNCALPGEYIRAHVNDLRIETNDGMPVTGTYWRALHPGYDAVNNPDATLIETLTRRNTDVENEIIEFLARHRNDGWKLEYVVQSQGNDFPVGIADGARLLVHNYHDMAYVNQYRNNADAALYPINGSRVYINNEDGLKAFFEYLNASDDGMAGLDVILQNDVALSSVPELTKAFAGTLHGDGYTITLPKGMGSLLGDKLDTASGKVYNLGVMGGTVATAGKIVNCYDSTTPADDLRYGRKAYELSHYFTPFKEGTSYINHEFTSFYVYKYYENGDYQYATTDKAWSLRTDIPHYNSSDTHHDKSHKHDAMRWVEAGVRKEYGNGELYYTSGLADGKGHNFPVYDASTDAYNNDFLFFGQHLDKTNADLRPVHINSVASGDVSYEAKGGNRVYRTAGYNGSSVNNGFYYNKDAWALSPMLTAIDFTNPTSEAVTSTTDSRDGANTDPVSFNIDSNADYGTYSNETTGHVTQNILIYNADATTFPAESDNTQESAIRYHSITKTAEGATAANLHLVDKQDFWCPIAFDVTGRAWYERLPQSFRTIGDEYNSVSAWEGICLPFTVKQVSGKENGNILSHFYGEVTPEMTPKTNDRTLHHEYWLTGMVNDGKGSVTFARPSVAGAGLFVDAHQDHDDYLYENTYYRDLPDYNTHFGTRDDDNWYAKAHTFSDYVFLSKNTPYLIAFPGESFYEFDLTGQTITFEATETTVPVTEDMITTVGQYKHKGTFIRMSDVMGVNADGSAFESGNNVLPFRTYMPASAGTRAIIITDGGDEVVGEGDEPDEPQDELGEDYLRIYGDGLDVVVETSQARSFNLYSINGSRIAVLHCKPGKNRFTQVNGGFYLVGRTKILLR